MATLTIVLQVLLVITSLLLTLTILMHKGKGGGLSDMFGGGLAASVGQLRGGRAQPQQDHGGDRDPVGRGDHPAGPRPARRRLSGNPTDNGMKREQ